MAEPCVLRCDNEEGGAEKVVHVKWVVCGRVGSLKPAIRISRWLKYRPPLFNPERDKPPSIDWPGWAWSLGIWLFKGPRNHNCCEGRNPERVLEEGVFEVPCGKRR